VAALLEDEGYSVSLAGDGLEALTAIEGRDFDLVLSDVKMPKLDGLTLARRLRRDGYDRPIVLMSAVFTGVDHTGMTIVPKPFDFSVLLDRVEEAIAAYSPGAVVIG
jgi:DNA-binding response OmpR family regulator